MRTTKDKPKEYIGYSDSAFLVLVGEADELTAKVLKMGGDGDYFTYMMGEEYCPDYYKLVATFKKWVRVYDDERLVKTYRGDIIEFWRAGDYGVAIRIETNDPKCPTCGSSNLTSQTPKDNWNENTLIECDECGELFIGSDSYVPGDGNPTCLRCGLNKTVERWAGNPPEDRHISTWCITCQGEAETEIPF